MLFPPLGQGLPPPPPPPACPFSALLGVLEGNFKLGLSRLDLSFFCPPCRPRLNFQSPRIMEQLASESDLFPPPLSVVVSA